MSKNLSWRELKALSDLYTKRKSQAKIQSYPYIKRLLELGYLDLKLGNHKVLIPSIKFDSLYESQFQENYAYYKDFLDTKGLESDARKNYKEDDIQTLMLIYSNKTEIVKQLPSLKIFSAEFFKGKGSKYLENNQSVRNALYKILDITEFSGESEKTQQWRFVVDCSAPKAVVLCENLSFLKTPWQALKNNIELWYVGGNNIAIIDNIGVEKLNKPLFYSCDWDFAGLQIYCRIKTKLSLKCKEIKLLIPNALTDYLPVSSPFHASNWDFGKAFSGLNESLFLDEEIELIKFLILKNSWIEEESNNLLEMLKSALNCQMCPQK